MSRPTTLSTTRQRRRDPLESSLLLSVPDAATLLGVSDRYTWDLVRSSELPSVRLGRRVLVPRAALERIASPTGAEADAPAPAPLPLRRQA